MLGNITNDNLITGPSVNQSEHIREIEKEGNSKNPYVKSAEFNDSLEISKEAKELLQKEQDIEFFTSLALESPYTNEDFNAILELIQKGEYIDNKDLAEALESDNDLLNYLFQDISAAS